MTGGPLSAVNRETAGSASRFLSALMMDSRTTSRFELSSKVSLGCPAHLRLQLVEDGLLVGLELH